MTQTKSLRIKEPDFLRTVKQPTFLINERQCRKNIASMQEKAITNGVTLRPHFKTHQSVIVANWFKEAGITCATVSSVSMAQQFAEAGWDNLTIAFPVNLREMEVLNRLAGEITLNLLAESTFVIRSLQAELSDQVNIFVKIDVGTHRTGIPSFRADLIKELILECGKSENTSFRGLLAHAGHSYAARGEEEICAVHQQTLSELMQLKSDLRAIVPGIFISVGDTPTCSVAGDFSMVDEIRPGNFVYYDLMQEQIGSCGPNQIAVAMACPIVALHPEREEVIIHGGAVHFSKEALVLKNEQKVYGRIISFTQDGWEETKEVLYLHKLSQEHGIIKMPRALMDKIEPGDLIGILPVHACLTANLMSETIVIPGK